MKKRMTIYLILIMGALVAACVFVYTRKDNVAPVINIPEKEITYMEGQDTSVLLEGVTASDDRDGDITDNIRIYDISVLDGNNQALITYAAYDKSNNIGKASRTVSYKAKQDSDDKTIEKSNSEVKTDKNDKGDDKSDEEDEFENKKASTEEGYDDPPLESEGDPVIRLTEHEAHIGVGGDFRVMKYVEDAVDDEDTREYLFRNVYLDGEYDEYTPGEYELTYFCVDSDGNKSNGAKLMLYVEKEKNEQ